MDPVKGEDPLAAAAVGFEQPREVAVERILVADPLLRAAEAGVRSEEEVACLDERELVEQRLVHGPDSGAERFAIRARPGRRRARVALELAEEAEDGLREGRAGASRMIRHERGDG